MNLLDEAENFKWKEQGRKIVDNAKQMGFPDKDLGFYELLRFFDITSLSKMDDETMRKVDTVFKFLEESEDIIGAAIKLDSKLGKSVHLSDKLDKMYSHIHSLNIEGRFDKDKVVKDKMTGELIKKKKGEKAEMDFREKIRKSMLKRSKIEELKRRHRAKVRETAQRRKKEKIVKKNLETIEKRKSPEPKKNVEISDFV